MPNPFDQFDNPAQPASGNAPIAPGGNPFDQFTPQVKQSEAPPAQESTVAGIGKDIVKGSASGLVQGAEGVLGAMEWFAPEDTGLESFARDAKNTVAGFREKNQDFLGESDASKKAREDSAWNPRGWIYGGFESIGMMAPGLAVGLVNPVAGGATVGAQFWGKTAQDAYDEAVANEKQTGKVVMNEREKLLYSNLRGFWEGGIEALQSRIPFSIGKILPKSVQKNIIQAAVRSPGNPVLNVAKHLAATAAAEVPMEVFQEYAGQKTAYTYGQQENDPGFTDVAPVIGPTIIMSAVLGFAGHKGDTARKKKIHDALTGENVSPEARAAAVKAVYDTVAPQDQELAAMWLEQTAANLAANKPVAIKSDEDTRLAYKQMLERKVETLRANAKVSKAAAENLANAEKELADVNAQLGDTIPASELKSQVVNPETPIVGDTVATAPLQDQPQPLNDSNLGPVIPGAKPFDAVADGGAQAGQLGDVIPQEPNLQQLVIQRRRVRNLERLVAAQKNNQTAKANLAKAKETLAAMSQKGVANDLPAVPQEDQQGQTTLPTVRPTTQNDEAVAPIILRKDGKPYGTEAAAGKALASKGLAETHTVVKKGKGFALVEKPQPGRLRFIAGPLRGEGQTVVAAAVDESMKRTLGQIRDEMVSSQAGGKVYGEANQTGGTQQVSGYGSSYPDYFRNLGIPADEITASIDKVTAGKPLTQRQAQNLETVVQGKRSEQATQSLSERARKLEERRAFMPEAFTDEEILDFTDEEADIIDALVERYSIDRDIVNDLADRAATETETDADYRERLTALVEDHLESQRRTVEEAGQTAPGTAQEGDAGNRDEGGGKDSQALLTEQTTAGEQVKMFATPPTFGKAPQPGENVTSLDFNLAPEEAGLFDGARKPDFDKMVSAAAKWKGATMAVAKSLEGNKQAQLAFSRMTTKADLDAYLMREFGANETEARDVSNWLTSQNIPADNTANVSDFSDEPWGAFIKQPTDQQTKDTNVSQGRTETVPVAGKKTAETAGAVEKPFASFVEQKNGAIVVLGDPMALSDYVKPFAGTVTRRKDGIVLTKAKSRFRESIPVTRETLDSGAIVDTFEDGGVMLTIPDYISGVARNRSELENIYAQEFGAEKFQQVFGKQAPSAAVDEFRAEQERIAQRREDNKRKVEEEKTAAEEEKRRAAEEKKAEAERAQKAQEESEQRWKETIGSGRADNPYYQAFLDTVEDPDSIKSNAPFMAWIGSRRSEFAKNNGERPFINSEAKPWDTAFGEYLRTWADEHLASRLKNQTTVESHNGFMKKLYAGEATIEEYRAAFDNLLDNKEQVIADLGNMTKDAIIQQEGYGFAARWRNEKKDAVVRAAYDSMLSDFILGDSLSYGMGKGAYENAIRAKVEARTEQDLADFAAAIKAQQEERIARKKEVAEAVKDPKTLDDFRIYMRAEMDGGKTFTEARLSLSPEQRATYDELVAEKNRNERKGRKDATRNEVRAAGQTVSGEIIETTHTQKGYALFVVQLAERVSKEDYQTLNASAKKLGGYYSSFRGRGAVPGFQFKSREEAEAFKALAGGDTSAAKETVSARRDAFEDDRSQSAVERLTSMADALEARAEASLNQDRKANTDRRARMAASAEASARQEQALARTMRNIAKAIEDGKAKFLDRVRQKTQIEYLSGVVRSAKYSELRTKYHDNYDRDKHEGEAPTIETADFADFPQYTAYRSDLAKLARQLLEVDGTKKLGQRLLKVADDVSDVYLDFARENLHKVSTFSTKDGKGATFSSKADAETAINRSGFKGQAVVLPFKRGRNTIILSPAEAMKRGIWEGDNDKRITLSADLGTELVEKIGRTRGKVSVPWQFETAHSRLAMLKRMNIESPSEFRAAIREFIGLSERPAGEDRIKKLERSMIGRRNDGLDFFPTPETTADEMVAAAGIEPGMSVLEPSAGWGHIAERIREAGTEPDVVELSGSRRELLQEKGFNVVGSDFMELEGEQYDRIIMNPPFSDRRDAEHVQHAYGLLKPGGRMVAIMGEGVFFGSDKKAQAFRDWLDSVDATDEKLAEGTFNDPTLPVNTGVNARMVVIDKPADAPRFSLTDQTKTPEFKKWFGDSKVVDENGQPLVVYHGTDNLFDQFSQTSDIGFHFGTEYAARDRAAKMASADILVDPVTLSQVEKDSLAAINGEIGGNPVDDLYVIMLRKLDSPRNDLRAQIAEMDRGEIDQVKEEYLEKPDSAKFTERVERAREGEGFRVEANGEVVSTHKTAREANARASVLRRQASKPMALYLSIQNPIRLPDLGVWPAQEIAKEVGFSELEMNRVAEAGDASAQYDEVRRILQEKGFDGVVYRNEVENVGEDSFIAFSPTQIKSAIGNNGQFDGANPDIRFSAESDNAKLKEDVTRLKQRQDSLVAKFGPIVPGEELRKLLASVDNKRFSREDSGNEIQDLNARLSTYIGKELPADTFVAAQLPESMASLPRRVGNAFGARIVFFKNNRPDLINFNAVVFPGKSGVIYVNQDAANHGLAIVGHEVLHFLRNERPALYDHLAKVAQAELIASEAQQHKYFLDKFQAEQGLDPVNDALVLEEIIADFIGEKFTEPQFWDKVAATDPGKFRQLVGVVKTYIRKVLNSLTAKGMKGTQFFTDAKNVEDAAAKALARYMKMKRVEREGLLNVDPKFAAAWHGSPHDFDKFSMSAIGTGEGAQAYGHGLYFAGRKEVAEYYRENLSGAARKLLDASYSKDPELWVAGQLFSGIGKEDIKDGLSILDYKGNPDDLISNGEKRLAKEKQSLGRLYSVELAPQDDEYLLWDRPVLEQSEKVKEALQNFPGFAGGKISNAHRGSDLYKYISRKMTPEPDESGMNGWTSVQPIENDRAASEYLHSLGIRGIKYLDGTSRSQGDGAFNYVLFSDADVTINAKFKLTPQDMKDLNILRVAIQANGKTYEGTPEEMHSELFGRSNLFGEEVNLGWVTPEGKFMTRSEAAQWVKKNTPDFYKALGDKTMLESADYGRAIGIPRRGYDSPNIDGKGNVRFWLRPSGGVGPSPSVYEAAAPRIRNAIDYLRMKFQDKFIPLLRVQDKLESDGWVKTNENDAYRAEELFHGKATKRLEDFYIETVQPLIDSIKNSTVSIAELESYLYARFVPQRNAHIASINPEMPDGGSGMTDQEASDILDTFRAEGKIDALEALAVRVREITAQQREIIRNEGLELDETMDAWELNNPDYVPLKGGKEDKGKGIGTGFNVKRSGTKQALGRRSRATNILAHLFEQTGATIVRAEKVKVSRAFLKMVEENPGSELFKLHETLPAKRAKVNGEVREVVDSGFPQNDNVLTITREDGSIVYVEIFDDDLARVMKNMTPNQYGPVTKALAATTRYLSKMSTSLNPEFVITNFERDFQTAMVHLGGEQSFKMAKKVAKSVFPAMKGIHNALRGDKQSDWAKWFERYQKAGAQVSFMDLRGAEDWQRKLANVGKDGKLDTTIQAFSKIGEVIGDYNSVVENAMRLSAFRHAIEGGMSESDAASLAKNLTVNFNRKGELGPALNALYMFANAGIQGSARIFQAVGKSRKVKAMMGATVMMAFGLAEIGRLSGGEDDDGEDKWDKLGDYTKQVNLIFMQSDGNAVTIRLPYGYNVFVALGYALSDIYHGRKVTDAARFLGSAFMNAFNPFGGDESLLKVISPTLVDPLLEIATNENFMGDKIMPENMPFGPQKPDSQLYFRTATGPSKAVTEFLNSISGGSKWEPGVIDISPETLDHIAGFAVGGLGRSVGRLTDLPGKIAEGDVPVSAIPFLRQVYREPSPYVDFDRFYSNVQKANSALAAFREMPAEGRAAYRKDHPEITLSQVSRSYQKSLSALRGRLNAARDAGNVEEARNIEKRMQQLVLRFNGLYNRKVAQ